MSHLRTELKPMLRVAGPVVAAELGWMSMGVVDTIMVGPLGAAAIAAVGVGNSLHMAFAVFGMGLLLGLDTLVSQALGAGQLSECRRWLHHGIVLALALTFPMMLACYGMLLAIPALGFHADVEPLLQRYFVVIIWSSPFLLLYSALRRYLIGMHRVTPLMFTLITANIVNAAANWVLIHGHYGFPALGVPGSAWATLLARLYMLAVLTMVAGKDIGRFSPTLSEKLQLSFARLRRLVNLGFPAASQITLEVGVFAAATALAGKLAPVAAASHQIALNIASVSFMVPYGLASAGAVRVGHAVGANDPPRAAGAGWTAILLGIAFMGATALAFLVIPRTLIGLFTQEEAVLALGSSLLFVAAVFQLFDGIQGVTTGVLRGLGDTRTPMITNLAGHWLFGLPVGYSLCFVLGLGVIGLWIGLSIGLMIVGVILLWIWAAKITAYQRFQLSAVSDQRDRLSALSLRSTAESHELKTPEPRAESAES